MLLPELVACHLAGGLGQGRELILLLAARLVSSDLALTEDYKLLEKERQMGCLPSFSQVKCVLTFSFFFHSLLFSLLRILLQLLELLLTSLPPTSLCLIGGPYGLALAIYRPCRSLGASPEPLPHGLPGNFIGCGATAPGGFYRSCRGSRSCVSHLSNDY